MSNKTDTVTFERVKHEAIPALKLRIHPQVQRALSEWWVNKLVKNFNKEKFGELTVIPVEGADYYYIIDGQHRYTAAVKVCGLEQRLPCAIKPANSSIEQQADKFLGLNDVLTVKALDRWFIRRLANDETVLEIEKIAGGFNLSVERSHRYGKVQAVAALESVYNQYGAEPLARTLKILFDAWGATPDAYESIHVKGVGFLVGRFNGELDDKDLSRKLAKGLSPAQLVGQAKSYAHASGISLERGMSEKVLMIYNKNKSKRLELR